MMDKIEAMKMVKEVVEGKELEVTLVGDCSDEFGVRWAIEVDDSDHIYLVGPKGEGYKVSFWEAVIITMMKETVEELDYEHEDEIDDGETSDEMMFNLVLSEVASKL